jgi:hypothetical protein
LVFVPAALGAGWIASRIFLPSRRSKSSPPRCVLPAVASTRNTTLLDAQHRDVERAAAEVVDDDRAVLAPSMPAASEAAVGSLMMRRHCRPRAAPRRAWPWRWLSSK